MLEYARSNGTNPQFMLLLMKLYGHLGATECITVLFQALNIKHLQMDSLGYAKMLKKYACMCCSLWAIDSFMNGQCCIVLLVQCSDVWLCCVLYV